MHQPPQARRAAAEEDWIGLDWIGQSTASYAKGDPAQAQTDAAVVWMIFWHSGMYAQSFQLQPQGRR